MKFKKLILPLLVILVTLVVIHVNANTPRNTANLSSMSSTLLDSNLFTQKDDLTPYVQNDVDMTNFTKTIENDELILYVNDETFAIRIFNKKTNFYWSSDIINLDDTGLSKSVLKRIRSAFMISYVDRLNRLVDKFMLDSDLELSTQVDQAKKLVTFNVDLKDFEIKLAYTIKLNGSTLEFALDHDSIEEYGKNRLMTIQFYEFLGAARKDQIPGYNFIPSGNGALVRYGAISPISSVYRERFYGQDLYYTTETNSGLHYPIYGSVHGVNQNGYLFNITSGAEYAQYNYSPTGVGTDYHTHFTKFYLRESYIQKIAGSTTSTTIYEKDLKDYDIHFNITFLSQDEANYVGMAKAYKQFLIDHQILNKTQTNELSIHLDALGADYEEGIFFNKTHKMTTVNDLLEINEELTENGVNQIFYTLRGFNKGGYTNANYTNYSFNKSLGNVRDLQDLDVAYYYNPVVRYSTDEKVPRNTLETITRTLAQVQIMHGDYYKYYTDIVKVADEFDEAYEEIEQYGGMALDGLSNQFYSNKNYTRHQMYEVYNQLIAEDIPMYNPNFIMLDQTSKFLNLPLQHDRLRFFTDSVPFMQIVLSGYMPYYSNYLNFSANMNIDVLKVIDYGANPAYLITKEPSYLLTNTLSRGYYASYYGNLNQYIINNYQFINNALKSVMGEEIIARVVVDNGIVAITYENQVQIIVNYTNSDYNYNGNPVKSMNYLVLGS